MNEPLRPPRKKRNSSRVNLTFSVVFHGAIALVVFYFAAREGVLGKKLKELTVTMVQKEKQLPKEKPPEQKVEPPKTETPKVNVPQPKLDMASAPPPANDSAPAVAPAVATLPSFNFSDGAHAVESISDANGIYKALVERSFRTRWERPEDIDDSTFVAEAQVNIDKEGEVTGYQWMKGSGNSRWDNSVKTVLDETKSISRPPPKGFPAKVLVRFDVESVRSEDVGNQFSSR